MYLEQISHSNEYFYSFITLVILGATLLACLFIFCVSYNKLRVKHKRLNTDFASASAQKKEVLELLNFQQTSVTNIGANIQSLVAKEFEQQSTPLLDTNEYIERRESKKHNWHKVAELAERLAYFTLRNQPRDYAGTAVSSKSVFADNEIMLNAMLRAKNQSLKLVEQSHKILNLPKGALDKILRGVVLQASRAGYSDAALILNCDVHAHDFNFSVTVPGAGISRKEMQNIDLSVRTNPRFHYAKRAQDNEGDLNLASIYRLVAQFGGSVKVVSALNYVTVIYVSLPSTAAGTLPEPNVNNDKPKRLKQINVAYVTTPAVDVDKQRVLIIDQNDSSQMILHRALQSRYQCFACKTPLESMQLIHNLQPVAILMDHVLSDIDPLELIKLIREDPQTENIPIIVVAGIVAQSFRLSALRLGASCLVEKPITQTQLQLTVAGLLEQQRMVDDQVGEKLSEYHSQQLELREETTFDSDKDRTFISRFNDMMAENFSNDNFTREIAANHMNVCLRTLNRRLNEYYSHNFKEHLRKYRLEQAKALLNKGYTINEASVEVGFNSASYFSTCFKTEYGFAPSRLVSQYG